MNGISLKLHQKVWVQPIGAAKGFYNQGVKAANTVGSAISGAYQQGKELAGKVWASVTEFANGVIKKISDGLNAVSNWVVEQPSKIKSYLNSIYDSVVEDMRSAYESLKDKSQELALSIQNIWNTIATNTKNAISAAKSKMIQTNEAAKQWYETNKQLVIAQAQELQQSTISWMKEAGKTVIDITNQVASGTITALKWVGIGCAILVFGPIIYLYKKIQQIPDLYNAAQKQVESGVAQLGQFWEELGQEFNKGVNVGLSTTSPSTGKIPIRDPKTGRMMAAPNENKIFKFSEFVNEKINKDKFFKKLK